LKLLTKICFRAEFFGFSPVFDLNFILIDDILGLNLVANGDIFG